MKINEPVHKMLVLFSCVNTCSERADELAHKYLGLHTRFLVLHH